MQIINNSKDIDALSSYLESNGYSYLNDKSTQELMIFSSKSSNYRIRYYKPHDQIYIDVYSTEDVRKIISSLPQDFTHIRKPLFENYREDYICTFEDGQTDVAILNWFPENQGSFSLVFSVNNGTITTITDPDQLSKDTKMSFSFGNKYFGPLKTYCTIESIDLDYSSWVYRVCAITPNYNHLWFDCDINYPATELLNEIGADDEVIISGYCTGLSESGYYITLSNARIFPKNHQEDRIMLFNSDLQIQEERMAMITEKGVDYSHDATINDFIGHWKTDYEDPFYDEIIISEKRIKTVNNGHSSIFTPELLHGVIRFTYTARGEGYVNGEYRISKDGTKLYNFPNYDYYYYKVNE